jgi:hypothetical protein
MIFFSRKLKPYTVKEGILSTDGSTEFDYLNVKDPQGSSGNKKKHLQVVFKETFLSFQESDHSYGQS